MAKLRFLDIITIIAFIIFLIWYLTSFGIR